MFLQFIRLVGDFVLLISFKICYLLFCCYWWIVVLFARGVFTC